MPGFEDAVGRLAGRPGGAGEAAGGQNEEHHESGREELNEMQYENGREDRHDVSGGALMLGCNT